jgi:secreted trypsin-like serine protease
MTRSFTAAAFGLMVASSIFSQLGCAATGPGDESNDPGDDKRDSPIVNGQETSEYPATGMLLQQGQVFCTGTVVGPRTVLTAAHCVEGQDASQFSFGFGPSQDQVENEIKVVAATVHPKADTKQLINDVAVVTLGEDAPVAPIAMNQAMDAGWVGRTVILVGYGVSDGPSQSGAGTKRMVGVTIDQVDATTLHYTTKNGQTACNGDSGGPAFADDGGNLVVAGITSYGDQNCQEYGVYTRVDTYLDFINEQIATAGGGVSDPNNPGGDPNDPGVDPNNPGGDPNDPGLDPNDPGADPNDPGGGGACGSVTYEGQCDGNKLSFCDENGELQEWECDSCGFNDQAGYYDCL